MTETTRELAEFILRTSYGDLPQAVQHEAARAFLNIVGCAFGGSTSDAVAIDLGFADTYTGPRTNTVIGQDTKLDPMYAAMVNSHASAAYVFDDTHLATVVHPGCTTGPAALAVAEMVQASGEELLNAVALGIEVQIRLARAINQPPAKGNMGWYTTSVCGTIGAAAAAAKLLKLDLQKTIYALGLGAVQAGGFRAAHATMCVSFAPGMQTRDGVAAALYAQKGINCSNNVLEGRYGFGSVFALEAHMANATDALGSKWWTLENTYKPYPSGIVIHPLVDAALNLYRAGKVDAEKIKSVSLRVNPMCLVLCDRPDPKTHYDAQVSVYHWVAAALLWGKAGIPESLEPAVHDPKMKALRAKITAKADDKVRDDEGFLSIEMQDGTKLEEHIEHCIGGMANPMTDKQLEEKFSSQSVPAIGAARTKAAIEGCWNLPKTSTAALTKLLTKSG